MKQLVSFTSAAVVQLLKLQQKNKILRFSVEKGGCAGNKEKLEYINPDELDRFDELVEDTGKHIKIAIEARSLLKVIGSQIDYVENDIEERFVIRNPNIKSSCGCGISVSY